MHTGMLWFDNSKTLLMVKVQKAVEYYLKKYGKTPDLCLVHPSMLNDDGRGSTGGEKEFAASWRNEAGDLQAKNVKIDVRPYRPVLPGHIWIGIEDKGDTEAVEATK